MKSTTTIRHRAVFSAQRLQKGAYVIWITVGGQTIVGWPRVLQIIPGTTLNAMCPVSAQSLTPWPSRPSWFVTVETMHHSSMLSAASPWMWTSFAAR